MLVAVCPYALVYLMKKQCAELYLAFLMSCA